MPERHVGGQVTLLLGFISAHRTWKLLLGVALVTKMSNQASLVLVEATADRTRERLREFSS